MSGHRSTLVALAIGAASAIAQTAGQVVLAALPAAESSLEAIAMRPDLWVVSHVLIALAVVGYAVVVILLLTPPRHAFTGRRSGVVRAVIIAAGLVLAVTGVLVQGAVLGIDAVIGGLALASIDDAPALHRVIGESVLPLFDAVDIGLTIALMLAALVTLVDRRSTVVGATVLVCALAVPGFTDVRVIAPALVAVGFVLALVLAVRHAREHGALTTRRRIMPLPASAVIVLAVLPAAVLSTERLMLALVMYGALAAVLVADRADRRASAAPMRTANIDS